MIHERSAIGQAIRDENDLVDVAYLALLMVMVVTVGAIPFMCIMAYLSWQFGVDHFDPQPLGIAIGATCGGFAAALGSLAGYMLATRTQHNREQTVVAPNATVVTQNQPQAAEAATDVEPTKRRR